MIWDVGWMSFFVGLVEGGLGDQETNLQETNRKEVRCQIDRKST